MYWLSVIKRWFSYSDMLFGALIVANWIAVSVYTSYDGIGGLIASLTGSGQSKNSAIAALMMLTAPLVNIYIWLKWSHFFFEAEDDIFRNTDNPPPLKSRKKAIIIFSALAGSPLITLTAWLYTQHIEILWGTFPLGILIFPILAISSSIAVLAYLPSSLNILTRLDESIDRVIEDRTKI